MIYLREDKPNLLYQQRLDTTYVLKMQKLKPGEKISILSDTMFKTMFLNDKRLKYSCKFLSYYLDISYEELLAHICLIKNEVDKEKEKDKGESRLCSKNI